MKKSFKFLAVAAMAFFSMNASALEPQWSKGTMIGNAQIGLEPFGAAVSLDYVLVDEWCQGHFTVGGEINVADWGKNCNAIGVTPRCTYGLNITNEFEVHAIVGLGVTNYNYKDLNDKRNHSMRTLSTEMVGCRYFFTDAIAVNAEVGYSNYSPEVRAGISYRF